MPPAHKSGRPITPALAICLLTALSVLLFAGCSADSSMPESELEPDIEPFVPSIFDARATVNTSMSEDVAEIWHAHYTGRWLLRLLTRGEAGSRAEFQEFVGRGEQFVLGYKLNRATQMIETDTLPNWAVEYFVNPPDEEHALVGCTIDQYTGSNLFYWAQFGHEICEGMVTSWLRGGGNESWAEWLINTPN
jgi:hypothetical protein